MANEEITIYKVDTNIAVKNINDLRENISTLKQQLGELTIGTDKYKEKLTELEDNQAALRNAMHGTATSMEQIAAAAKGSDQSYNGLVRTMAKLKEELRATDTSTAEGMEQFKFLAKQVDVVNSKLKALDQYQGNYQRNVGNYKSALDGLSGAFKATAGSASSMIAPLGGVTMGLKALSATPAVAILGLLANVISKVVDGLKSSEQNTMAMQKALAVFQPILNATTNALQTMANWLVKIVEGAGKAARWLGLVKGDAADAMQALTAAEQQVILDQREMQVYESRVQADIAQLQADAADKTRKTAAERKKAAEEAQRLSDELFNRQYELAQRELDVLEQRAALTQNDTATNEKLIAAKVKLNNLDRERAQRQRAITRQENGAVTDLAKQTSKATAEAQKESVLSFEQIMKMWDEADRKREAQEKWMADDLKGVMGVIEADTAEATNAIQAMLDAQLQAEWDAAQKEKEIQQQRLATFFGFTNALSDIAGSIADIYEADSEADEQAAQKAKALRTASAIIATLSGAVAAFTSTWSAAELPYTAKMVLAPTNAAAVLAAGYAQVKQINAVKVGNASGGGAAVPAPAFSPAVSQVRNITGASEEERLNRMASNQRVYLVYSDLEIANTGQRVKVRETEF